MQHLFMTIMRLSTDDQSTVLIQGEPGTGKELIAKAIHEHSLRADQPFVTLNCAAMPAEVLECELFGWLEGAFPGADTAKKGRLASAHGGSLFLDEIEELPIALQTKLLRVVREGEFIPVGGHAPIPVDVRIIAASGTDLEQHVSTNRFRKDLYYRLCVIPMLIPPLRERTEDIPLLIDYFIQQTGQRHGTPPLLGFDAPAMDTLMHASWKGNVRELENLIYHMTLLFGGSKVHSADLPEKYRDEYMPQTSASGMSDDPVSLPLQLLESAWQETGIDFNTLIDTFENQLILRALNRTQGNKKEAARLLNLKRTTLVEKMKKKALMHINPTVHDDESSTKADVDGSREP